MSEFKLNLQRPLCFFDLETTGLTIGHDRIVEIAIIKIMPDGEQQRLHLYVDPEMEIPQEASDIHGLTMERLRELQAKPFGEVASRIVDFLKDSDLAGYNSNKFDIPLLVEELKRVGREFDPHKCYTIDVQNIFHKMESRTLSAAYKFYVGDNGFDRPHCALDDTEATVKVLMAQVVRYAGVEYKEKNGTVTTPIVNDVKALAEFSTIRKNADYAGRIGYDGEGQEVFNFGQNKGKRLREFFITDSGKGYYRWMMEADFSEDTKAVLKRIFEEVNGKGKPKTIKSSPARPATEEDIKKLSEKFAARNSQTSLF